MPGCDAGAVKEERQMNKDRLAQIKSLFHQVLSYAPEARTAYLEPVK